MNIKIKTAIGTMVTAVIALSCSSETVHDVVADGSNSVSVDASAPNDAVVSADAAQVVGIPGWALEDIQPLSGMFGQTYGLNAFPEKILVAVLVEGF